MTTPERHREGIHPGIIFLALLLLLGGAWFSWQWFIRERSPPPPSDLVGTPPSAAPVGKPPAQVPAIPLPALAESDALVREVVGRLSAHPKLAAWMVPDQLIERFVAAVDNVARGESPRRHLEMLAPESGFEAGGDDQGLTISPRSQARYDLVVTAIESLDTAGAAALLHQLEPLLNEAYRELGYPDGDFAVPLARALQVIRGTPVVESPALTRAVESFRYADPDLESLPEAQKHLLRMGPANMARLQEKLRLLGRATGLSEGD